MRRLLPFSLCLLMVMLIIAFGAVYTAAEETSFPLKHVDTEIFNEYISALIKAREADIQAVVTQEEDITDFILRDADFDIISGIILIQFTLNYKEKTDIRGALRFEVRISDDGDKGSDPIPRENIDSDADDSDNTPEIGVYCLGLDGSLHSSKFFANLILAFAKKSINKRLMGKQFWSDQQDHPQYRVFKNENLTAIVNQIFMDTPAGKAQFQGISQTFPGGKVEVEFNNLGCNRFDIALGQAEFTSGLAGRVKFDILGEVKLHNAGTMVSDFDFYIDPRDQSWWARLRQFKLHLNLPLPNLNDTIQEIIDQELSSREILIPLDMPQLDQV